MGPDETKSKSERLGIGGMPYAEIRALRAPDEAIPRQRLLDEIADSGSFTSDGAKLLRLEHAFLEGVVANTEASGFNETDLRKKADAWLDSLSPDELAVIISLRGNHDAERESIVSVLMSAHSALSQKRSITNSSE